MAAARFSRAWSGLRSAARASARYVARKTPHVLCDGVGFAGAGLVAYGAWLIYPPAGFLVGGVLLIVAALFLGRRLEAEKA